MITTAPPSPNRTVAPLGRRIAWGWILFSAVTVAIVAVGPYLTTSLRELAATGAGLGGAYADQPLAITIAFYIHVVFGGIALIAGPLQFARGMRERAPRFHRWVGRVSIGAILIAAVAGLVIAPVNSAGFVGVLGFGALALLWGGFAVLGYRAIRRRDIHAHREWMTRTFALTYAAVTLRLWIPVLMMLFIATGTPPDNAFASAYVFVPFLSWVPNLLFAEWLIRRSRAATRRSSAFST